MTTGQRIKEARKKAGMTQAELADKLDIPFQSVSQWERDIRNPKKETLEKLANIFGCYYFELYGDEEGKEAAALMKEGVRLGLNAQIALPRTSFLAEYQQLGYSFEPDETRLVSAYNKLNLDGQTLALVAVESLVKTDRYRLKSPEAESVDDLANDPQYQRQDPPTEAPQEPEDTDTASPKSPSEGAGAPPEGKK